MQTLYIPIQNTIETKQDLAKFAKSVSKMIENEQPKNLSILFDMLKNVLPSRLMWRVVSVKRFGVCVGVRIVFGLVAGDTGKTHKKSIPAKGTVYSIYSEQPKTPNA